MEGVLVSAQAVGSSITVTVVSDSVGRYAFPKGRLSSGPHLLHVRAAGYDLVDPGPVVIDENRSVEANLKLRKTANLAAQLTNGEWLMSIEGTADRPSGAQVRLDLLDKDRCAMCHAFSYVTRSTHDSREWVSVIARMRNHSQGSSLTHPDDTPYSPRFRRYWGRYKGGENVTAYDEESGQAYDSVSEQAQYLASISLSSSSNGTWRYPLRTLPRPKGPETAVIMTEYDLPRPDSQPHDAAIDPEGNVWYQDFGQDYLGRLDPRTGEVKEWRLPALKPYPPFAEGGLDVQIDSDGNPWLALMRRAAIIRFDRRTEKMTVWEAPSEHTLRTLVAMIAHAPQQNMVWFDELGGIDRRGNPGPTKLHGLDLTVNHVTTTWDVPVGVYSMKALSNGNLVFFAMGVGKIGELDTKTGKSTLYSTPTPDSGPRRGHVDAQDRVWFGEYLAGKIGMFDTRTKRIMEWAMPVPYADPYDVITDKHGYAWSAGMVTDYVFRLDPTTGQVVKFLMPTINANVRRIDVDHRADAPVAVWIGENHHGKILKVEPLDGL